MSCQSVAAWCPEETTTSVRALRIRSQRSAAALFATAGWPAGIELLPAPAAGAGDRPARAPPRARNDRGWFKPRGTLYSSFVLSRVQNAFLLRTVLKIPTLESTEPVTVSLRPLPATQLRLLGLTGEPLVEWMRTKPQRQPPGGTDPPAATDACGMEASSDGLRTGFPTNSCAHLNVQICKFRIVNCGKSPV